MNEYAYSLARLLLLVVCPLLSGQQAELDKLIQQSFRLRGPEAPAGTSDRSIKPAAWTEYETTLRDWIESRLPSNITELDEGFLSLQNQLTADLLHARVLQPPEQIGKEGYVSEVKLTRPAGSPETLIVQTGISIPCGSDVSLSVYRFTGAARIRLLEANVKSPYGKHVVESRLSAPDESGNRILFAAWTDVQCASNWNMLDYRLYRIAPDAERAVSLFSGSHSFTVEDDPKVKLSPAGLLLEFTAEALEGGFRRAHVMHYQISGEGAERVDPVALQPQDFVHEWLERPWS